MLVAITHMNDLYAEGGERKCLKPGTTFRSAQTLGRCQISTHKLSSLLFELYVVLGWIGGHHE